jgi:hypothetical protein
MISFIILANHALSHDIMYSLHKVGHLAHHSMATVVLLVIHSSIPVLSEDATIPLAVGVTIVGDRRDPAQEAFANLLRGLLKQGPTAWPAGPTDYPRLSLFLFMDSDCSNSSYLNQVF